jgi:hypothetical protein
MSEKRIVKCAGKIQLGESTLACYVLTDGTRVLSGNQMQEALKLIPKSTYNKSGSRLARLLNYEALKSLTINRFGVGHFEPIECYNGQTKINGYEATLLADICDMMLEARNKKLLRSERQIVIANQCEVLMRSFAKVGIIALVDEATGYQYEREKHELQVVLQTFISEEIQDWKRIFELSFYKEIYRLWNIPFTPKNIKHKPQFIGILTAKFVYENLPKGTFVLQKLKDKTPRTKGGYYRYKLHQSLTKEVGREALKKVINSVEALASVSENKKQFLKLLQEKYGQKELPFPNIDEIDKASKIIEADSNIKEENPELPPFDNLLKAVLNVPKPPKEPK